MSEEKEELRIRSEEYEYRPEEMVVCGSCGRKSPPNRLDCFYCGNAIELDADTFSKLEPVLRQPDEDSPGVSLVLEGTGEEIGEQTVELLQSVTGFERGLVDILKTRTSVLPVAYTEPGQAVDLVKDKLEKQDCSVELVSDQEFDLETPTTRLRGLEVGEDDEIFFILFNNDEIRKVVRDDVTVVVIGEIAESSYESHEKHKRKKGLDKVIGTTEAREYEVVVDIYTKENDSGYRLMTSGFDFSFLGKEKGFLAKENLEKTIDFLRDWIGGEKFVVEYRATRPLLDCIWIPIATDNTKSIKRTGFGNFEKKRIVSSTNEEQFLRFSRLQNMYLGKGVSNDQEE